MMTIDPVERIKELKYLIRTIESQLPKHSVPASMLIQIEEWEEELEKLEFENEIS